MYLTQCKHCGEYFSQHRLEEAIREQKTVIFCEYCNSPNPFSVSIQDNLKGGFKALAEADFGTAEDYFVRATEESLPQPDAFLGAALAQMHIQAVFSSEDPSRYPQLTFYRCPEDPLVNHYFDKAFEAAVNLDPDAQEKQIARINRYQEHINGFRERYLEIAARKSEYGVFIAYEDEGADFAAGFEKAIALRNLLPERIGAVFVPGADGDDAGEDEDRSYYEASVLYALEHAKCMAVIADSNINSRLRTVYTRYFYANKGKHKNDLCFVRIARGASINLPDNSAAEYGKNLFDFADRGCIGFICKCNGLRMSVDQPEPQTEEPTELAPPPSAETPTGAGAPQKTADGKYIFGFYPQTLVTDKAIVGRFSGGALPDENESNGWTKLFSDEYGPYTWYKDEEIDGVRYRAIYFTMERKPFLTRENTEFLFYQSINGYEPMSVYCFRYEPIVWKAVGGDRYTVELVTDLALDCHEFGLPSDEICWENSDLRLWLNEEFAPTAFGEIGGDYLMRIDESEDTVFLPDLGRSDRALQGSRFVMCSDYFMCLGGRCNNHNIDSFWIASSDIGRRAEAPILTLGKFNSKSSTYPDSTMVAVLPRIMIRK